MKATTKTVPDNKKASVKSAKNSGKTSVATEHTEHEPCPFCEQG